MMRVPANRYVLFFGLAAAGLTLDLYSKSAVFAKIGFPGNGDFFFEGWVTFRFWTSFNEGALWGLGQGYTWIFALLSGVAVLGILYWLFVARAACSLWLTISLASIMAGTLGNLYDRLGLHGHINPVTEAPRYAVRDFLLFTFGGWGWPIFNFADMFLVTGAIMLVVHSFRSEEALKESETPAITGNASVNPPSRQKVDSKTTPPKDGVEASAKH